MIVSEEHLPQSIEERIRLREADVAPVVLSVGIFSLGRAAIHAQPRGLGFG
jgi:hypothetical protein